MAADSDAVSPTTARAPGPLSVTTGASSSLARASLPRRRATIGPSGSDGSVSVASPAAAALAGISTSFVSGGPTAKSASARPSGLAPGPQATLTFTRRPARSAARTAQSFPVLTSSGNATQTGIASP